MSLPAFMKIDSTTCEIQRMMIDPDHAFGASPGVFSEIATGVVCALDRSAFVFENFGEDMALQGLVTLQTFKLFLLSTQDILIGDKVIVGVKEYKVKDVISFLTHKEAVLTND